MMIKAQIAKYRYNPVPVTKEEYPTVTETWWFGYL
jgi:hypothetical protein